MYEVHGLTRLCVAKHKVLIVKRISINRLQKISVRDGKLLDQMRYRCHDARNVHLLFIIQSILIVVAAE